MNSNQRKTALRCTGWKVPFLCEIWGVHRSTVVGWLEGEHAPPAAFDAWLEQAALLVMEHKATAVRRPRAHAEAGIE